jgi:hypothetical protein
MDLKKLNGFMTLYRAWRGYRGGLSVPGVLLLAACAGGHAPPLPPPAPSAPPGAAAAPLTGPAAELQRAQDLIDQKQFAAADAVLEELIASADFRRLEGAQRHQALQLGAVAALGQADPARALSLLRRACALPESVPRDWYLRMLADSAVDDRADAAASLVTVATRWPQQLPQMQGSLETLSQAVQALAELGSDAQRYLVLRALFDAHFIEEPEDASGWWRDLALLQLARDERAAAVKTLARITDPYVVVSIEADKRFDPIRNTVSPRMNVSEVGTWSVGFLAAEAQLRPRHLALSARLAARLIDTLRLPQALQISEAAIERVDEKGPSAYLDYDTEYYRIVILRAGALYCLGRWDAALEQLKSATELPAGTGVSVRISLAGRYSGLGRPQEALAVLKEITRADVSPYGETQVQLDTLLAQAQLHDERAVQSALDYLSAHRAQALDAYQEALLAAHRDDAAAQLLMTRLADPRLRSDALIAVQEYAELSLPPAVLEEQRRWRALIARPDVAAAIAQVGSQARYALAGGFF